MKSQHNVAVFQQAGDFTRSLRAQPVVAPTGLVHLQFSTRWAKSRQPNEDRVQLNLCLTQAELQVLIDTLQQSLLPPYCHCAPEESKEAA